MKCSRLSITAIASCVVLLASVAVGQDKDATVVTIGTPSGASLAGTYWESSEGKESPILVLLHGEGGNRKKWELIAGRLQRKGYAVLTVDLRKHGESAGTADTTTSTSGNTKLKPNDYLAMISDDMEGVKRFLMEKHHAGEFNIRKTGLVAIGAIASVAINAAAIDWARAPYPDGPTVDSRTPRGQDIRSVVLISPDKGAKTMNAVKATKPVYYLVVVGSKDKTKKTFSDKLVKSLQAGLKKDVKEEQVMVKEYATKLNGEDLVAKDNGEFLKLLTQFHDLRLKSIPQPWRDRHNRLNK